MVGYVLGEAWVGAFYGHEGRVGVRGKLTSIMQGNKLRGEWSRIHHVKYSNLHGEEQEEGDVGAVDGPEQRGIGSWTKVDSTMGMLGCLHSDEGGPGGPATSAFHLAAAQPGTPMASATSACHTPVPSCHAHVPSCHSHSRPMPSALGGTHPSKLRPQHSLLRAHSTWTQPRP